MLVDGQQSEGALAIPLAPFLRPDLSCGLPPGVALATLTTQVRVNAD